MAANADGNGAPANPAKRMREEDDKAPQYPCFKLWIHPTCKDLYDTFLLVLARVKQLGYTIIHESQTSPEVFVMADAANKVLKTDDFPTEYARYVYLHHVPAKSAALLVPAAMKPPDFTETIKRARREEGRRENRMGGEEDGHLFEDEDIHSDED